MRLSSLCLAALRFTLTVAALLLFSSVMLAQHSSGGGGGSSGGGGGGGSHGGSSGGSSFSGSSGSGHSSGGSASHGSSGHNSSSGSTSSHFGWRGSQSHAQHSIREPNGGLRTRTAQPAKRGFFSFLRHPFRKPERKPLADLRRRPICVKGACPVCPTGQVHSGGGCVPAILIRNRNWLCSPWETWSGGDCLLQTRFLDDCSGVRMAMEQQAQRMRAAEAAAQSACSTGARQDCSDLTSAAQSEANLYRELQNRYQQCRQRSLTFYPFSGFGLWSYSPGLSLEGERNLDYQ